MSAEQALELAETLLGKDKYDIAIALIEAEKRGISGYAKAIGVGE